MHYKKKLKILKMVDGSSENNIESDESIEIDSDSSQTATNYQNTAVKISKLNDEELSRFETFRRVGFKRSVIKRMCYEITGQSCNPRFIIAVSGLSKVFVGELCTEAKKVQERWNETGPLLPSHIHEAWRLLTKKMPNMNCEDQDFII